MKKILKILFVVLVMYVFCLGVTYCLYMYSENAGRISNFKNKINDSIYQYEVEHGIYKYSNPDICIGFRVIKTVMKNDKTVIYTENMVYMFKNPEVLVRDGNGMSVENVEACIDGDKIVITGENPYDTETIVLYNEKGDGIEIRNLKSKRISWLGNYERKNAIEDDAPVDAY